MAPLPELPESLMGEEWDSGLWAWVFINDLCGLILTLAVLPGTHWVLKARLRAELYAARDEVRSLERDLVTKRKHAFNGRKVWRKYGDNLRSF